METPQTSTPADTQRLAEQILDRYHDWEIAQATLENCETELAGCEQLRNDAIIVVADSQIKLEDIGINPDDIAQSLRELGIDLDQHPELKPLLGYNPLRYD